MKQKLEDINCTICGKLICKKQQGVSTKGIYFWCPRCKKNFEISDNDSAPVAKD